MRPIIMRCELTSHLGRTRPARVRSRGSETLLRIRSSAGYTIDTHESRFRKRQVLVAIDGQPRGLLPDLFEVDDRRVVLVLIIRIKPHDDGKGALPLEADEIIAGDRPHIHDLSESRANGHERGGQ